MRYLPHTPEDIARMLGTIGVPTVDTLFAHIPEPLRAKSPLDLGPALDEAALLRHLGELAARNRAAIDDDGCLSFLGAGLTPHYIASAVDAQLTRTEWYTAYTPYQPEISQGTLQAMFEYQTIAAEVLGLPVANASMYDGSTACAEAVLMARRVAGEQRNHVVVSDGLHPHYRQTTDTYLSGLPGAADVILGAQLDATSGRTDLASVEAALKAGEGRVACVVVQTPNQFGVVEDLAPIAALAHREGALLCAVTTEPLAFGVLKPPGALDADIACGEGLGLSYAPSLGGPAVGLFAAKSELLRAMPGRLIGETVDKDGRRGYVLTLATREQHIRREKATSNICTNTGLMALAFTINMCLLGRAGFRRLAQLNLAKAEYAKKQLAGLAGFSLRYTGPTFNEFALRVPGGNAPAIIDELAARGIFGGVNLGDPDTLVVAVTERNRQDDIDVLARALGEVTR